jgi:predicted SnoaL-like aldol condensation-catalyzing enzyme
MRPRKSFGRLDTSSTVRTFHPDENGFSTWQKNSPATLKYENQLILANGDFVMLHGRFSGLGPGIPNWIVADVVRIENGVLAEHWDVIQNEATRASSKSGLPMFGDRFTA